MYIVNFRAPLKKLTTKKIYTQQVNRGNSSNPKNIVNTEKAEKKKKEKLRQIEKSWKDDRF